MARGKFNKRGGGKRVDAQSADEIEQRNQRLAEFEETRAKRRAEEEEGSGDDADTDKDKDKNKDKNKDKDDGDATKIKKKPVEGRKPDAAPVEVTSSEDHKKNLSKLEAVRKRREIAEARRKMEQEEELTQEMERTAIFAPVYEADDDDDGKKKKKKSKDKEIPKLTKIEIKKMKPALMKEALKERNLDIQGNKNALTTRLIEYETSR